MDPTKGRPAVPGKMRLLFAGRFEHGQKGVLDLPLIDRALVERGVDVSWTMVGAGPDEQRLRDAWPGERVTFLGATTTAGRVVPRPQAGQVSVPTRVPR